MRKKKDFIINLLPIFLAAFILKSSYIFFNWFFGQKQNKKYSSEIYLGPLHNINSQKREVNSISCIKWPKCIFFMYACVSKHLQSSFQQSVHHHLSCTNCLVDKMMNIFILFIYFCSMHHIDVLRYFGIYIFFSLSFSLLILFMMIHFTFLQ